MVRLIASVFGFLTVLSALTGCNGGGATPAPTPTATPTNTPIPGGVNLQGTATYDYVPAIDNVTEGGVALAYSLTTSRPIRRALVQAIDPSSSAVISQTMTDDFGKYTLPLASGSSAKIRVLARSQTASFVPTQSLTRCNGASWDFRVVDNTRQKGLYVLDSNFAYPAGQSGITVKAPLVRNAMGYVDRSSAPFAILDSVITEVELLCQARPAIALPKLYLNWSVNNSSSSGDSADGDITTTHYSFENDSNIYILGEEDVDTDEFDDHVIAHEFGHYLEDRIFRSDTLGGAHSKRDLLDPRVAFSEGFGNALSAMTFNDPIYVDTNGIDQYSGFTLRMDLPPSGDDRSVYSESSVQNILWQLYLNRGNGWTYGSIDRILYVLGKYHRPASLSDPYATAAFATLLSFGAHYNAEFGGNAEYFRILWETQLDIPYHALCAGSCYGIGDIPDPFDSDNDIGRYYASASRRYPQGASGSTQSAAFWQMYRTLQSGTNASTAHERINWGGYSSPYNKLGNNRLYRYTATTAGTRTVSVSGLSGATCASDVLDMVVYHKGTMVNYDDDTGGCPQVSLYMQAGETYTVHLYGIPSVSESQFLTGWFVTVN